MKSYKIIIWADTDEDLDFVTYEVEHMELHTIEYNIIEVRGA